MATLRAPQRALAAARDRGLALPRGTTNPAEPSRRHGADQGQPKSGPTEPVIGIPIAAEPHTDMSVTGIPATAEPSNKQRKRTEFLARQRAVRNRLWPLLSERFPLAFRLPPPPLAVGIHAKILEALAAAGEEVDGRELSIFMRYWCTRWGYLRAIYRGEQRVNLDGSVAGVPTLEQRNTAGRYLWGAGYVEIKETAEVEKAP